MTLDDAIRVAIRGELRAALREDLPELLRETLAVRAPASTDSPYLSTARAAKLAGVRPETVRSWIAGGKLPGHRAGRLLRVRRDELEALMAHGPERGKVEVDLDTLATDIMAGRMGRKKASG
jgi:excisionase family DNA binding protein